MKIALIVLVASTLMTLVQMWFLRTPRKAHQEHLMRAWNILAGYRKMLPPEPQPLDEAMLHVLKVLEDLGVPLPTCVCGEEDCPAGSHKR